MPDYKDMYQKLFCATENAIDMLISAQREVEEVYISDPEPEIKLVELPQAGTTEKDDK
ncbi:MULTISPECIES: hypothetical protein [Acutalibacteraceae]|uniref:hypothetical protein n=1 Tax=Acutalibacteraceae TaxID=3082771 RepID=UPI0013E8E872|nr:MULTISPECIES: hypothetical protein [Acutalibacteraceae]